MLRCSACRGVALVTLAAFLASCTHWTDPEPVAPSRFIGGTVSQAKLFLADGRELTVHNPFIARDSMLWVDVAVETRTGQPVTDHGVPLALIGAVRVEETDATATTLLVLAGVGVTIAIVAAAGSSEPKSSPPPSSSACTGDCELSCPLVYSWNGHEWRLDSGTFGGAIMRALERTDVDNLDFLAADSGVLRLKVANQQDETDYLDALSILALDHDSGFSVAPDAEGRLHTLGTPTDPIRAGDLAGRDALARVARVDGWNWESSPAIRDTSIAENLRDGLELAFLRPAGARFARLVVDANVTPWATAMMTAFIAAHGRGTQAWYDSLAAAPARARDFGAALAHQAFLTASVWVNGAWRPQGLVWDAGPEIVKRQVVPLDLGNVAGDTVRVRLESIPSLWLVDHVALDYSTERPVTVTELTPREATDRGGADIRAALRAIDEQVLTLERGDSARLTFSAPPVPSGKSRTYLLRSTGWYRIHSPLDTPPDVATLQRVVGDPNGLSKEAVARMNAALVALERRAR